MFNFALFEHELLNSAWLLSRVENISTTHEFRYQIMACFSPVLHKLTQW